ncbi:MAG: ATPase, T2SS/T4P/T4SS family [Marinobacterium sp.]|nr:ATPase, T2SS/T4P/T4SS family [Marinobacterium sp.]
MNAVDSSAQALASLLPDWLQQHARLSSAECQHILQIWQQQPGSSLPCLLLKLGTLSSADLSRALSELLQLPQLQPSQHPRQAVRETELSSTFLQHHRILPVAEDEQHITLAMTDPANELAAHSVALACQKSVRRLVIDDSILQQLYNQLYVPSQAHNASGDKTSDTTITSPLNADQLRDMASEAPIIQRVNQLLGQAVDQRASDIHIEPFEQQLSIRLRRDGILHSVAPPPARIAMAMVSRIKIMAQLDIAERRLPQDGRINIRIGGVPLDIRVSTVPCVHGETVVMRLLRRDGLVSSFDQLGLRPEQQHQLEQLLHQANGLIVVSGPTGSGKTTTLYTALQQLNRPERKIITVEDPVEYRLEGINQIQVRSDIGLTFASALRTIVRQDPDTIMVGEMRDHETAEICVQSALTGHLVLSTLHTNQAAGCLTRLLEMGVADYLLTSTLLAAVGQRLVRRLCHHCAEAFTPDQEQFNHIHQHGHIQQCRSLKTENLTADNLKPHNHTEHQSQIDYPSPTIQLYRARGCQHCNHTGYQGRIVIMEILPITPKIQQLILQQADAHQLQQAAVAEGMRTLYADGCRRVLNGETTLDEILRVTRE